MWYTNRCRKSCIYFFDSTRRRFMHLLVTRHGETTWNVQNKICGRTDAPLTPRGIEQAHALAQKLCGTQIDTIICSPLFFLFDKLYPSYCSSSPPQDSRTIFKLGFTSRPPATFPRISDMNIFILFFHSNCITISCKIPSGFPRKYSYKHLL